MKPLPHQQRIIDLNPKKAILNWEMRTGKTLPATIWIDQPHRAGNTFIITKKSNKKSWQAMNTKATVLTKEEFKKHAQNISNPTAIVVDELHHFASALFVRPRSQLATALYTLLKDNPDCHFLGLTATPVRNSPWSFHTLLCYIGVYIPWKEWRSEFFELVHMPFMKFPGWLPKSNWRELMVPYVEKYTDIVALKDVVDTLPPVTSRIVKIKQKPYHKPHDELVTWHDEHLWEQQNKYKEILELGYKKIIVVAYYTDQLDELATHLAKEKPVFVLDGRTRDPEAVIAQAQQSFECYLLVQSGCGEGWDGHQFGAMVFCSMDHTYVSNVQMHGRQRHPTYLRDIEIIYIVGGRWDARILEAYRHAENFNPHSAALFTETNQRPRSRIRLGVS